MTRNLSTCRFCWDESHPDQSSMFSCRFSSSLFLLKSQQTEICSGLFVLLSWTRTLTCCVINLLLLNQNLDYLLSHWLLWWFSISHWLPWWFLPPLGIRSPQHYSSFISRFYREWACPSALCPLIGQETGSPPAEIGRRSWLVLGGSGCFWVRTIMSWTFRENKLGLWKNWKMDQNNWIGWSPCDPVRLVVLTERWRSKQEQFSYLMLNVLKPVEPLFSRTKMFWWDSVGLLLPWAENKSQQIKTKILTHLLFIIDQTDSVLLDEQNFMLGSGSVQSGNKVSPF